MHILYQMTCLSWVISSAFTNPEPRYTTESVITHNATRRSEISRAIAIHKSGEKINEKTSTTTTDDDDKKTLAQQVADGKYGLIQKELFLKPAKRPGIISYEINPEVPKDNINNLGGLEPEEIWLAENHLLVLKGGGFPGKINRGKPAWPPIDNYVAPKRQVKIPPNPRIPPPFPVQLKEGGAIQFIRARDNATQPYREDDRNNTRNATGYEDIPLFPPGLFFPPASGFKNITELDEDDPRIYYPPPYDFVYPKDNSTTRVPPGPLVPGIVLPPPPDFFAPLRPDRKNGTRRRTESTRKPQTTRVHSKNKTTTARPNKTTKTADPSPQTTTTYAPNARTKPTSTEDPNNGWIPIPGRSRPTEVAPIKPHYAPGTVNQSRVRPTVGTNPYFPPDRVRDYYADIKDGGYFSTTPSPFEGFRPLILNLPETVRPTAPPIYPYPLTLTKDKQLKETYIYYGDPEVDRYRQTTGKPMKHFSENEHKTTGYETNTPLPPKLYPEPLIEIPQAGVGEYPKELAYYDQNFKKETHQTEQPFRYIYYNDNRPKDLGYTYDVPVQLQSHYGHDIGIYDVRNTGNKLNRERVPPTTKPPIYEYSFSAPGYGTGEAPKIATTPKPAGFQNTFAPPVQPQFAFFDYLTTPKNHNVYRYNEQNTNPPKLFTTLKPNFERNNGYPNFQNVFRTENPFNAFLAHDNGMMGDMAKKYLNTFGQKVNNGNVDRPPTTPLPRPSQNGQRKPQHENRTKGSPDGKEGPVKFQQGSYNAQSDYDAHSNKEYYEKPNYELDAYKFSIAKPQHNTQAAKYPQIYSTLPNYEPYEYEPEIVRPNHPLGSDVNVNYKNPPPLNPDAEFIYPQYMQRDHSRDNSYISYQLPGSGGHFFFLTPRSIKAENYHLANSGFQYPNAEEYNTYQNGQKRVRRKRPQKSD